MYKIYFLNTGVHVDSNGYEETYTRKDLEEIKESYDPNLFESPIVIGHDDDISSLYTQKDSIPAYGWVKRLGIDDKGLYAEAVLAPELEKLISRKVPAYKHISGAIYSKNSPSNPKKGKARYLRHIAFLGGSPPAIKGLPKAVKLYKEQVSIEHSLINYKDNLVPIEKMTTDKQYNESIPLPSLDAPIEEIESFLKENAKDFLIYILTDGEYGYPGEITRFEPEVTKENNYLYNPETGKFSGIFYDDFSSEVDGYEFEIGKRNGTWYSSYSPVNKMEQNDISPMAEESPSLNQSEESLMASEAEMTDEEESSLAQGKLPELTEEEEEEKEEEEEFTSISSELELLREEAKLLRNEVLRLKTEINEMKMNDFKNYTESKKELISSLGINEDELLGVFNILKDAPTRTYKEGVKSPADVIKTILNNCEEKLSKASLVTYGEFEPDGNKNDCGDIDTELEPRGVVADENSVKLHKEIVKYCKDNGLNVNNPQHYKEAYKALVTNRAKS